DHLIERLAAGIDAAHSGREGPALFVHFICAAPECDPVLPGRRLEAARLERADGDNSRGTRNGALLSVSVDRLGARFVLPPGVHALVTEDDRFRPDVEAHGRALKLVVGVPGGLREVGDPGPVKRMHDGLSKGAASNKKAGTLSRAGL